MSITTQITSSKNDNNRSLDSNWATAIDGSSIVQQGGFYCETSEFGGDYTVSQWYCQFPISNIPADAIVMSASLDLMPFNVDNTDRSWQMEIFSYDFGGVIGGGDFQSDTELEALHTANKRIGRVQHSTFVVDSYTWITYSMDNFIAELEAAIQSTATQFRIMGAMNKQRTASAPATGTSDSVSFYDHLDAVSKRPHLNITYHSSLRGGALFCMGH